MNKEQMTQEQRAQLIEKLRAEYDDLNGKIARLNAFLCDIDFVKKVPDPMEQELMKGQLRAMENYLSNLRGRIMFQEARQKAEKSLEEWMNMKGKIVSVQQRGPVRLVNTEEQHHCGQDVRVQYDPNESQPVNVPVKGDDFDDACCQARETCPVGDGSAVVEKPVITCESLKQLMDYQVIGVCEPGFPCEGCVQDHYNTPCVKVELVGGYTLCLAPLPNSIVTE